MSLGSREPELSKRSSSETLSIETGMETKPLDVPLDEYEDVTTSEMSVVAVAMEVSESTLSKDWKTSERG